MDKNKKLFPQRLWELIHDEKYNFCLRWSQDGQRVYLNRNEFETHYLKTPNNQFHTQKAISFVRQMNMYGFRKVDDCFYENDNFKRNCHHLLKNMIRKHSNKSFFSSPSVALAAVGNVQQQQQQPVEHLHALPLSQQPVQPFSLASQTRAAEPLPVALKGPDEHSHNIARMQTSLGCMDDLRRPAHLQQRIQQLQSQHHLQEPTFLSTLYAQHQHLHRTDQPPLEPHNFTRPQQQASPDSISDSCLHEVARSMSNLGAAMAALPNSSISPTTPLASSLYYRLAALNFSNGKPLSPDADQELANQLTHGRQFVSSANPNSLLASSHQETCLAQSSIDQRLALIRQQQQHQLNSNQINLQEATNLAGELAALSSAEQIALHQNLLKTFLQLKQPQLSMAFDKSFLSNLQDRNLLESLAILSAFGPSQLEPESNSNGGPATTVSPLELVIKKR